MATVTALTAQATLALLGETITGAEIRNGILYFYTKGGSEINAGAVGTGGGGSGAPGLVKGVLNAGEVPPSPGVWARRV